MNILRNNFDLIRLFAALQVALVHGERYMVPSGNFLRPALEFLPGVPIFFFISGFLIAASYERSSSLTSFSIKRLLRIYPALWLCVLGTTLSLWLLGYFENNEATLPSVLGWLAAQLSILQFYNPEFMRNYGAGIVNPALWTIAVELQFYFVMPVLAKLFHKRRALFFLLLTVLLIFSAVYSNYLAQAYSENTVRKMIGVSFLPWIGMFMIGNLAHFYWSSVARYFTGRLALWGLVYAVCVAIGLYVESRFDIVISGNGIVLPLFLPLAGLILSFAYSFTALSRLTGGRDISYGLYIWHMPIIGTWLYLGMPGSYMSIILCVAITSIIATLSWNFLEKPALSLKPVSRQAQ